MATPKIIQDRFQQDLAEINNFSHLSDEEKDFCRIKLQHALEGTNGLSQKDKIQSVSEDVYWLIENSNKNLEKMNSITDRIESITDRIDSITNKITEEAERSEKNDEQLQTRITQIYDKLGKHSSLFGFLTECKWAIVTTIAIICALLAFRPELSSLIQSLTTK